MNRISLLSVSIRFSKKKDKTLKHKYFRKQNETQSNKPSDLGPSMRHIIMSNDTCISINHLYIASIQGPHQC